MSEPPVQAPRPLAEHFAGLGRERRLAAGEVLFNQDDPAAAVFWISRGRLRLERHLAGGRVITLSVARAPAILAEASLFSRRYHCRAVAETAAALAAVPSAVVLDRIRRDPAFALSLVGALAAEVRSLRQLVELRNVRPAADRVLGYLAFQRDRGEIPADRPLAAVAAELGLTPEAFYRILARLERQNVIRRQGRRITLV